VVGGGGKDRTISINGVQTSRCVNFFTRGSKKKKGKRTRGEKRRKVLGRRVEGGNDWVITAKVLAKERYRWSWGPDEKET